jgi:hypothetical protein
VATVSGELDPLSTGVVYCELVCALQGIAQFDVAEQWTQAMERWCETNAIGSLHGRCRVHRAEILRLRGVVQRGGGSGAHGGDAGGILDARAKDAYRRRVAEIDDDIEQARAIGDADRAAQADVERDFLVREFARAFCLSGRERRAVCASERARAGVPRAVRHANHTDR